MPAVAFLFSLCRRCLIPSRSPSDVFDLICFLYDSTHRTASHRIVTWSAKQTHSHLHRNTKHLIEPDWTGKMALSIEQKQTRYACESCKVCQHAAGTDMIFQIPRHRAPLPHTLHTHAAHALLPTTGLRPRSRMLFRRIQYRCWQRKHIRLGGRHTGKPCLLPRDSRDCRPGRMLGSVHPGRSGRGLMTISKRAETLTPCSADNTALRVSLHHRPRDHAIIRHARPRKSDPPLRLPVAKSGNSKLCRGRIVDMPRYRRGLWIGRRVVGKVLSISCFDKVCDGMLGTDLNDRPVVGFGQRVGMGTRVETPTNNNWRDR